MEMLVVGVVVLAILIVLPILIINIKFLEPIATILLKITCFIGIILGITPIVDYVDDLLNEKRKSDKDEKNI